MKQAEQGISEMRKNVDTMIVVPNERLLAVVGKGIPFQDALKKADEVLLHATQGIASLITSTGIINVDFADVRTVMQNGGAALMGTGIGRGDNRALEAAQQAISSPLLDNVSIAGATGVLINIIGGDDLTLGETTQINDIIHDAVGDDAEIIFGAGKSPLAIIANGGNDKLSVGALRTTPRSFTAAMATTISREPSSIQYILIGGPGRNMRLKNGSAGHDILIGGDGVDKVSGSSGDDAIVSGFTNDPYTGPVRCRLPATSSQAGPAASPTPITRCHQRSPFAQNLLHYDGAADKVRLRRGPLLHQPHH